MIENEMPEDAHLTVSNHSLTVLQEAYQKIMEDITEQLVKICEEKSRSTVSAPFVIEAIKNLGFGSYEEQLKAFNQQLQTEQKAARKTKIKKEQRPDFRDDPRLIAEQERLFKEASERLYGNSNNEIRIDNRNTVNDNQSKTDNVQLQEQSSNGFTLSLPG